MRAEMVASSLVHAGMVLAVLFWTGLSADQDAPAIGTVTVDLITASVVTTNQTEAVESDATEDHALSGAEASNPTTFTEPKVPEVVPSETQTLMTTDTLERVPTEVDDVPAWLRRTLPSHRRSRCCRKWRKLNLFWRSGRSMRGKRSRPTLQLPSSRLRLPNRR
jgi:hypothetical protein